MEGPANDKGQKEKKIIGDFDIDDFEAILDKGDRVQAQKFIRKTLAVIDDALRSLEVHVRGVSPGEKLDHQIELEARRERIETFQVVKGLDK